MSPSHIDGSDDEKVSVMDSDDNDSMVITKTNKCPIASARPESKKTETDAQSSASALVSLSNTSIKSLETGGSITSDGNLNESRLTNAPEAKSRMRDSFPNSNSKEVSDIVDSSKEVIVKKAAEVEAPASNKSHNPSPDRDCSETNISGNKHNLNKCEDKRVCRWAELLWERPSTGNNSAMSDWLLKVLSVSDFEKPLKDDHPTYGNNSKNLKIKNERGGVNDTKNNHIMEQRDNDSQFRSKPMKKRSQSCIRQNSEDQVELKALLCAQKIDGSDRKKNKTSRSN